MIPEFELEDSLRVRKDYLVAAAAVVVVVAAANERACVV